MTGRRNPVRAPGLAVALALSLAPAFGAEPHTPKPGSTERRAILDALRAPVQKDLGQKVIFRVDHLKVQGAWAFLRGAPRRPDGKPIDYRRTRYAEARSAGAFDDGVSALLHRRASARRAGEWRVVVYNIGATDVVWEGWDRRFKAPSPIFR